MNSSKNYFEFYNEQHGFRADFSFLSNLSDVNSKLTFYIMKRNQASMLVRFCNFLVDSFAIAILVFIVVSILVRNSSVIQEYNATTKRTLGFLIYFLYYFLCEISFSSTPGKYITKTKIADNVTFNKPTVLDFSISQACLSFNSF